MKLRHCTFYAHVFNHKVEAADLALGNCSFHCWGSALVDTGKDIVPITVGVVESSTGEIYTVLADALKFTDVGTVQE